MSERAKAHTHTHIDDICHRTFIAKFILIAYLNAAKKSSL